MMRTSDARGFSLIEMLVSLAVLLLATTGIASLLIQNSRINKSQQMTADVQANARNCLEMVVAKLRSAGWDPMNVGLPLVNTDPDLTDNISEIEIFADLNMDGETDGTSTPDDDYEQIIVRHIANRVEWRPTPTSGYIVLATNISNDADGDGTPEPMFVPDDPADPSRIAVQITARSPVPDPVTRDFIRYTVRSDVVLRKNL